MRYAILSDIHSNLEALETCLSFLAQENIDGYFCLGDMVGYGPDPIPCLEKIKSLSPRAIIAGNHDWGAVGLLGLDYFNFLAKEAVIWTGKNLNPSSSKYLKSLSLIYRDDALTLAHGTLYHPEEFNYMLDIYSAAKDFNVLTTPICFIGHSHLPGVFFEENYQISYSLEQEIILKPKVKYIVNAGSVGQPRDEDPRSCLVIFDTEKQSIEFKRVEYNLKLTQKKIIRAGLPERLAARLEEGR